MVVFEPLNLLEDIYTFIYFGEHQKYSHMHIFKAYFVATRVKKIKNV